MLLGQGQGDAGRSGRRLVGRIPRLFGRQHGAAGQGDETPSYRHGLCRLDGDRRRRNRRAGHSVLSGAGGFLAAVLPHDARRLDRRSEVRVALNVTMPIENLAVRCS